VGIDSDVSIPTIVRRYIEIKTGYKHLRFDCDSTALRPFDDHVTTVGHVSYAPCMLK